MVLGRNRLSNDDDGTRGKEATMASKDKGGKSEKKEAKKNLKEKRAAKKAKKEK